MIVKWSHFWTDFSPFSQVWNDIKIYFSMRYLSVELPNEILFSLCGEKFRWIILHLTLRGKSIFEKSLSTASPNLKDCNLHFI